MKKNFSPVARMLRSVGFISLLVIMNEFVRAQQIPLYSQYYFNPMICNPALTGMGEQINSFLTHRTQWKEIPGSPVITSLTLDGPVKEKKIGLGASVYNYSTDIVNRFGINAFYSYHITFSEQSNLHLGLSAGVIDNRIDFSKAIVEDLDDPALLSGNQQKAAMDAGMGVAYNWKKTEAGFAIQNLPGSTLKYSSIDSRTAYTLSRNYLFSAKQTFLISKEKNLSMYPLLMLRLTKGAPAQYDFNLVGNWKGTAWLGISYRSDYCVATSIRVKIYNALSLGYTYDFITSPIKTYSGTSNEIMLSYVFNSGNKKTDEAVLKKYEQEIGMLTKQLQEVGAQLTIANQSEIEKQQEEIKALNSQIEQLKKEIADSSAALKTQIMLLEERVNLLIKLMGN